MRSLVPPFWGLGINSTISTFLLSQESMGTVSFKMGKLEREFSSGGIVIKVRNSKIKILLIKDPYGKWTWPKGKIDKGETSLDTAKREIEEETGLKNIQTVSKIGQTNYFYTRRKRLIYKTVFLYLFKFTGREALSIQKEEIADGRWFSPEEALAKVGYKGARELLAKAIKIFKQHRDRK